MNYLIIFIVMALVLSPVFWMMPSPRQKRQMALRQRAMSLGFSVKVCDLPQSYRAKVRQEPPEQGVCYLLPWRKPGAKAGLFHFIAVRQAQADPTMNEPVAIELMLSKTLAALSDQAIALEYSSAGVAVYWRERGDVEQVEQFYQRLKTLCDDLTAIIVP